MGSLMNTSCQDLGFIKDREGPIPSYSKAPLCHSGSIKVGRNVFWRLALLQRLFLASVQLVERLCTSPSHSPMHTGCTKGM